MKKGLLKKILTVSVVGCLAAGLLAGCGSSSESSAEAEIEKTEEKETEADQADAQEAEKAETEAEEDVEETAKNDYTIGVVFKSLTDSYYVSMQEGVQTEADYLGVNVEFQGPDSQTDSDTQIQMMQDFIDEGVDAIILVPIGTTELAPTIKNANDADIPVVLIDSRMDDDAMDDAGASTITYVGSDNYLGGQLAGQTMSEAIEIGQIAVLEGPSDQESSTSRCEAFNETIVSLGNLSIVESVPADWDKDEAYTATQNILEEYPDLVGLFAANDDMALGAIEAIDEAGLTDQITVIGYDALEDGRAAIDEGTLYASVAQEPDVMGSTGLELAIDYLNGNRIAKDISTSVYLVTDAEDTSPDTDDNDYTIGVVFKSLTNPFYVEIQDGIQKEADYLGVDVSFQAPDDDVDSDTQIEMVAQMTENYINQGVDAIILAPVGTTELAPVVKEANDADIPILLVDSLIDEDALDDCDASYVSFVSSNNYLGGQLAGQAMSDAIELGKVAVIEGLEGQESSQDRVDGFTDTILSLGNLTVVASEPADWDTDEAYSVCKSILEENPDLAGLFSVSEKMTLGAIQAIEEAGMQDQITVIGFDYLEDGQKAMKDGEMYAAVAQEPETIGDSAIDAIVKYLNGKRVASEITTNVSLVTAEDAN